MPCCLAKRPLKHDILGIYLTIFLGVGISGNTLAMTSSFFGKCLKFNIDLKNAHFPCSVSKGPLKHGFLDIYLTMFFGAGISRNTSAIKVILFLKMFKI